MNIKQKVNEFRSIVNNMADLYEKKNSNYGDSFGQLYKELGPTAGLVPLWNKLHRATSLIKGNQNNFESLEDTLKDLACYAIMNLIEMEAQKEKEIKSVAASPEYTECDVYKSPIYNIYGTFKCYGCKHTNCPHMKTDPCKGCETKRMLNQGLMYVKDLPCEWCDRNPYKISCGATTNITIENTNNGTSSSIYETIMKGSNSNE